MRFTPFKLEQFFAKHEFSAPRLLCNSDCESMSVGELLALEDGAEAQLRELWLGYTDTQGAPELRKEVAALYARTNAEQTLVLSGAEEGIYLFMQAALKPGDHVVAMFPAYQSLYQVADDLGCEVTRWNLVEAEDNSWSLDFAALCDSIRPDTRALVINTPHNPTGYSLSEAELQAIVELARTHDLYLFSDEVYAYLEHEGRPRPPSACDCYEKAVSLGVMSKSFGLPGLRIGWVATRDADLLRQMRERRHYTTICNSAPSEFLATLALRHKEVMLQRTQAIIRANIEAMQRFMEEGQRFFAWSPPPAGPICFPRLRVEVGAEKFCQQLLKETGVLLLPSTVYDYGDEHVRLGLGRRDFEENLSCLAEFLRARC
jgi:aspartate/methionine/tyrosine aminotransferase